MRTGTKRALCGLAAVLLVLAGSACAGLAAQGERAAAPGLDVYNESLDASEQTLTDSGAGLPEWSGGSETERLIVRNGSLEIVVADTEEAVEAINGMADELQGFVVRSDVSRYQQGLQANVEIRVPAESFDDALEGIKDLATEVRHETTTASDVTEEYIDLQSHLRNREATQARLLEYLEDAEDTEAALAVDEHLRSIEAEIEELKGRIQYLDNLVEMATIAVDITPDELAQPIEIGGWHPEGTLRDSFEALVGFLRFLVDALIVLVVLIIPALAAIAAPVVAVVFAVRAIRRRRRKAD